MDIFKLIEEGVCGSLARAGLAEPAVMSDE
jgi:hypothetical protein